MLLENSMKIYTPIAFNTKGRTQESAQKPNMVYGNMNDSFSCNKKQNNSSLQTYNISFGASKEDYLKRRIIRLYNAIYNDMAIYAKEKYNLDFIKPNLKFMHSYDSSGEYIVEDNSIAINILLRKRKTNQIIPADPSSSFILENGEHSHALIYAGDFQKPPKVKHPKRDEENAILAETISHELSHAVQAQLGLSDKNAKQALTDVWRKYHPTLNHLNDEELYEYFTNDSPFIRDFIRQEVYSAKIKIESPDSSQVKEVTALDILVSFYEPYKKGWIDSIEEIDAENKAAKFNEQYLANRFPKVHPERINAIIDAEYYNAELGSKILFENE